MRTQVDALTLVGATFAASLGLTLLVGQWSYLGSVVGLVLFITLFSYDQEGHRSILQSVAFSAVCGFCFSLAFAAFFQLMGGRVENVFADPRLSREWLPLTFVIATLILVAIDRGRMSGRVNELAGAPRLVRHPSTAFAPPQTPVFATPQPAVATPYAASQPAPVTYAPAPPQTPEPARFEAAHAYAGPQEPERYTMPASPAPPAPASAPAPFAQQPAPMTAPAPKPMPRGKETSIYVPLVGEGMNVLRPVRAEHLGRDYYLITEEMPAGETWEFTPGQVVRCRKKNLSSGKGMVAYEEAPRAS